MVDKPDTDPDAQGRGMYRMTDTALAQALTRLELAVLRSGESYSRWISEAFADLSGDALAAQDINLLSAIRFTEGARNLADVARFFNREDPSNIQYSLRKLEKAGLVERFAGASRRESSYKVTERGRDLTDRFAAERQAVLVELLGDLNNFAERMDEAAASLEKLTGQYALAIQTLINNRVVGKRNADDQAPAGPAGG